MTKLFYDTKLTESCPTRYYRYITGFEDYFYGNVSCSKCPLNAVQNPNDDTTCICESGYILREDLSAQGILYPTNDNECVKSDFTVFYDCNGGSYGELGIIEPQSVSYNETVTAAYNTCERDGYEFNVWRVNDDETDTKEQGEKFDYNYTSDITLNAIWKPIITPVILDSNLYTDETYIPADTLVSPDRLYSEYLGDWYTDESLTDDSKVDRLTKLPIVNGYQFTGFYSEKISGRDDPDDMYFASNGEPVAQRAAFGTKEEVTLYAHYKQCICNIGEGVDTCEVIGTSANNECMYSVSCKVGYLREEPIEYGEADTYYYTPTCDLAPIYQITLDSMYYENAEATTGTPVTENAVPQKLFIKKTIGWYSDAEGTVSVDKLNVSPSYKHYDFQGFYTGKAGQGIKLISSDGTLVTNSDLINNVTSDITIYAHYEPQKYSISFDCGIGTGKPHDTMSVTYGQVVNIPNDGACGGFVCGKFMGWKISDTDLIIPKTDGLKWEYDTDKVLTAIYDTTYNIKYEANNERVSGNAPKSPVKCTEEAECLVPENTYSVYGNNFIGWACTGVNECDTGIILNPGYDLSNFSTCYGDNITLIAQWENSKFNIIYAPNGGVGDNPALTSCEYGTECKVPENPYTYPGHEFVNWKFETDTNQSGLLEPNDDFASLFSTNPKTVTLIAQWDALPYTVVYHANGGTGTMEPSTFIYDQESYLSINKFERSGYTFMHWATNADGSGDIYTDGQTVMNLTDVKGGSVDLYAIWQSNTYTITLDPDGGTTTQTSISVKYQGDIPNAEIPTYDGYLFMGYFTDRNGAGDKFFDEFGAPISSTYTLATDITVYAYWKVPVCTDYDGSVLERCDDPIMSSQEMIDSGILESKSASEYKITDFDKYMRNQKWAVNFPTYGEGTGTISGSAFCGPVSKAEYGTVIKSIEDTPVTGTALKQAHAGCWCQVGPTDTTKFWVAAGKYDEGNTWAENTDACRANCPDFCAQLVATDSEFRAKLYGGEDSCPVGTDHKKACCEGEYETAAGTYEDCPVGSWCNNCEINKCDAIAMYTATNGATSPNACGTYLHVGDHKIFMRPNAKMTPIALHVNKRGTIFHANMSTEKPDDGKEKHLKAKVNDVIYYIYDNLLPI